MGAEIFIPKDTYEADEYVKRLATAQTPCFGVEFEYANEICQGCPLAGSCESQFLVNLRTVARQMVDTDVDDTLVPSPDPAPVSQVMDEEVPTQEFEAFAGSKCIVCDKEIPAKTKVKYNMREGFWHKKCHDAYNRGVRAKKE